jgi:hypothetical protein
MNGKLHTWLQKDNEDIDLRHITAEYVLSFFSFTELNIILYELIKIKRTE